MDKAKETLDWAKSNNIVYRPEEQALVDQILTPEPAATKANTK